MSQTLLNEFYKYLTIYTDQRVGQAFVNFLWKQGLTDKDLSDSLFYERSDSVSWDAIYSWLEKQHS